MSAPPELNDDATAEILLRLPPDEPAHLVRAALVCRPWRQILTDPGFLRRYRAFHRAPPLLGFFNNCATSDDVCLPRFFATLEAASPFPTRAFDCPKWRLLDCRHGRVLFGLFSETVNLVVWDPITGDHQELPDPASDSGYDYTAAVLCAVRGCDHLNCHGGPFRVVLAGSDHIPWTEVLARHYSSEIGCWDASAHLGIEAPAVKPSALVGNYIFFQVFFDEVILRYDMERNCLSAIHPPEEHDIIGGIGLMSMEDGSLGLAGFTGSRLCLWSTNVSAEGIDQWVRCRDIELMTGIPIIPCSEARVIGAADGVGIVFIVTDVGLFMVDLMSGRKRMVDDAGSYFSIFPFMSFYTPDCAGSKLPLLAEAH